MFGMLEITQDDMSRITAAVGVMLLSITENATSKKDIDEAIELHKLHKKLIGAMAAMAKAAKENGRGEGRAK